MSYNQQLFSTILHAITSSIALLTQRLHKLCKDCSAPPSQCGPSSAVSVALGILLCLVERLLDHLLVGQLYNHGIALRYLSCY